MWSCLPNPFRARRLPEWKELALQKRLYEMEEEVTEPDSRTSSDESWNGFVQEEDMGLPKWSKDSYELEEIFPPLVQESEPEEDFVDSCPCPPSTPELGVPAPEKVCIKVLCRLQAMILCGELEEDAKEEVVGGDQPQVMTLHDFHRHRDADMEQRRKAGQRSVLSRVLRWFCGIVEEPSFTELRVHCCKEYCHQEDGSDHRLLASSGPPNALKPWKV
ncbi:hypothetical protein BSKO_05625 [Bryopsis sp. KO-2023]|nr:hypothetical protein BSKO_05625 [Bryopsis sp. KO-2023]